LFSVLLTFKEHVCGIRFVFWGDGVFPANDRSLIIMNHRTRLDWMFLWAWMLRFGRLKHMKIILKDSLKYVPGAGWAMQQFGFLFLRRNWAEDRVQFDRMLKYFAGRSYPIQMLLFPEGTDLSVSNKLKVFIVDNVFFFYLFFIFFCLFFFLIFSFLFKSS
jgi:lysocardiolipin and lysophospholipid acyltransferase